MSSSCNSTPKNQIQYQMQLQGKIKSNEKFMSSFYFLLQLRAAYKRKIQYQCLAMRRSVKVNRKTQRKKEKTYAVKASVCEFCVVFGSSWRQCRTNTPQEQQPIFLIIF